MIALRNPDGSIVPKDPANPLRGSYTIPVPIERIVFPGGDTSFVSNLEYRITIAGPVALAPFVDIGANPILRNSQLRINSGQFADIQNTVFGCPALDIALNCVGGQRPGDPNSTIPKFSEELQIVQRTNWIPRMSTGLELQVFLPIINAPFRVYWAYNPLRLDTTAEGPVKITRDMFPAGAAGDFTFRQAVDSLSPQFRLREPRKTFRFSVATTF